MAKIVKEVSCGAIIFRRTKEGIKYLLLHYGMGHWGFVKGHMEEGETEKETVIRETKEETGITDLKFIPNFKEEITYYYKFSGKLHFKSVIFFLAETKTEEIRLSYEHTGYAWLSFEQALSRIKFENTRNVLRKANEVVKKIMRD